MNQTKLCRHCKSEIDKRANVCPVCRKGQGGCLPVILFVICLFVIISAVLGSKSNDKDKDIAGKTSEKISEITKEGAAKITEPEFTLGQKNALSKANTYLSVSSFSYSGLIKQLEFEGFSTEDSTFAVDRCGADWNEQAAKKAKTYLDVSSFSRQSLLDQLKYEGFTAEQAEYGVTKIGY